MDLVEDDVVVAAVGYSAVRKRRTCDQPNKCRVEKVEEWRRHMEGSCERTAVAGAVADDGGVP